MEQLGAFPLPVASPEGILSFSFQILLAILAVVFFHLEHRPAASGQAASFVAVDVTDIGSNRN